MESMVDLVAKVNQHRRRMAIEAEKKSNEAIRDYPDWNVVKEYPDGYRMVRLPDPADSEEAFKIGKACGEKGGWCTKDDLLHYGSGDSRVNLLLDPDGKPVAQVETVKPKPERSDMISQLKNRGDEHFLEDLYQSRLDVESGEFNGDVLDRFTEILNDRGVVLDPLTLSINQIKGKYNEKPKAEHIPYLQDFVKSGNFSDVSDLGNVDMENINNYRDSVVNRAREAGLTGNYFTPDEIYQYLDPGI